MHRTSPQIGHQWTQAHPQHAALQIATKLDAHTIITSDHGEALGPALFHGIPPTPQLAEVPLATTIPTKIEGIISLTEIPHLILQAIRGQTSRLGQKIAKTEYYETPRRHPCAKHQKITLYYTQKGHKTVVQEYYHSKLLSASASGGQFLSFWLSTALSGAGHLTAMAGSSHLMHLSR
jgi:hypothetical protein